VAARQERTWETLAAPRGREVSLVLDGAPTQWWKVEGEETVETEITGPRDLRIDLRCVLVAATDEHVPYVVELRLDGKRLDWHKFRATNDPRVTLDGSMVGDRDRVDLQIPEGTHKVGIRRVAGDTAALLARFRVEVGPER
jgi:hypothetical protein